MPGMFIAEINKLQEENEKLRREVIFFMKQARKTELRVKELEEACENFAEVERNLLVKLNCRNS